MAGKRKVYTAIDTTPHGKPEEKCKTYYCNLKTSAVKDCAVTHNRTLFFKTTLLHAAMANHRHMHNCCHTSTTLVFEIKRSGY